ncbi:hypothetical protein [Francisella sp. SYW-9]|uniref:hypothetical protein n=1 Tax=Francisella sp. SYW-9 TaxID=2610888 RepID=UPI00123D9C32|nr:hypothetical protein [Francisella sp. SYW-9]
MPTLTFDKEYRKLSLADIGPIGNLSNRVRNNIKSVMLKNIWPIETMAKFKMQSNKPESNQHNFKNLKEYLKRNSPLASYWLENKPQNIYLNFLDIDKFKECLIKNYTTRATFETKEQFLVFEGGDTSKYDDDTLTQLKKLTLHIDLHGKFLIAEMANYKLLAHCSTTKKSTEITCGHLGALLSYIKQGVLDIVSSLDLKCIMSSEEYFDFMARILDTFNLLADSCKTNIAKYQAQNYDSLIEMSDEHFFKEYTNLLLSKRISEQEQIKDMQQDYQQAKKEAYQKSRQSGQFYEKAMSKINSLRVTTSQTLIDARILKLKADINKAKKEGLLTDSELLKCGSINFQNSSWYLNKIMLIRYLQADVPFKIMEYGYKAGRTAFNAGKNITGSDIGGAATILASYYGLDMMLGAAFGIGIAPLVLGGAGVAIAAGYVATTAISKRADYSRYKGLKESLSLQQQSLIINQRRYFFIKSSLDYLILCGYKTDGMEQLARLEASIKEKIKTIENDNKELEAMDKDTLNIIQKSISENYQYVQNKAYGGYQYARDTASRSYNYLIKSIWG